MIGTIRHLLDSTDTFTAAISFVILLYLIALVIIHGKMQNSEKGKRIWNILCFVPLAFSAVHFVIFTLGSVADILVQFYVSIYCPSVIMAFFPLLKKKKPLRIIGNVICIAVSAVLSMLSLASGKAADFTGKSMSDAFISLCDYYEENYPMGEWKKIDYEKLKADGLVLIGEAEKTGDTDKYYEALRRFTESFHDGHMGVSSFDDEKFNSIVGMDKFSDYGLSLLTLDNGDTIAVNTEDGIEIKDGDVITAWNGVPVDEAADSVSTPFIEGSTIENERISKTFFLAGVGGETAEVTYINSDGKEAVAVLNRIEGNVTRAIKAKSVFTRSEYGEYDYHMLSDNIGYLRVTAEETNEFSDMLAYVTGDHSAAREMFREDLRELRDQGMTKLVIDIRNNAGGYEEISTALVSLFTKEKMYAFSLGVKNGSEMKSVHDRYVMGDGEFSELEIVVLTGMGCGSAGDGLSLYLSRLPNVTVAGLSDPVGINQEVGGVVFMPGKAIVYFPVGVILDENGNPNIDLDHTQQSRNPVDIKIPLDKEAALRIYDGEDYELEWAIDYLNEN